MKSKIKILQEEFGTETIIFQDDHFMADKERVHEILAYMRERGMSAFFPTALTLYALDRPMLKALQGVGVKVMIMAVESGSQRVLKEVMKKPLNQKIQRRVFQDCRELGIDTDVNIIIGMPGEKKEDIEVTTTNITADRGSINIDQFTSNEPELIQVAITIFSSY